MTPEQQAKFDAAMKECTGNRHDFERIFLAGYAARDAEIERLRAALDGAYDILDAEATPYIDDAEDSFRTISESKYAEVEQILSAALAQTKEPT
jgi:hypothetical protein